MRSWATQRVSPKGGASAWKAPAAASKGVIEFATPEGVFAVTPETETAQLFPTMWDVIGRLGNRQVADRKPAEVTP